MKRTDRADRLAVAEAETPRENVREKHRAGEPGRGKKSAARRKTDERKTTYSGGGEDRKPLTTTVNQV